MPSIQTPPVSLAAKRPPGTISRPSVIFLTVLGMLAVMAVTSVPATAQATTILVTTSADNNDVDEDCTEGSDNCTLREAVNVAESGDTIEFADGIDPQLVASLGQILIAEKDVVIVGNLDGSGPGTTISGGGEYDDRLFETSDISGLTLSNVTLTGGNADGDGGAIANRGTLTANNVHLHGNSAERGGAIHNQDGSVTITDGAVYDNEAQFGGGLGNVDGEVTIADTQFGRAGQGNTASTTGGGLHNLSGSDGLARVTIVRSTFLENVAGNSGGAIMNDSVDQQGQDFVSDSEITIRDSIFQGNQAGLGGAILNFLDGSSLDIAGSTFVGNEASLHGGALFNARGDIEAANSTFSANTAVDEGGAIMNNGADESRLVLTHVTIVGNTAAVGGGLFQEGAFTDFFGNRVVGEGNSTLTHSILADNAGGDCDGSESDLTGDVRITSTGHNLDSDESCNQLDSDVTATDVMLGDLADNGGSTMTHLPLEGSPAIEGGLNPTCLLDVDQRGEPRPGANSGACDIGAVEVQIADEPDDEPDDEPEDEDTPELEPAEPVEAQPAVPVEAQPDFTG